MSNPSNLYAEKVFGEHPTSLWPLDDTANYIQLIPAESRDLSDSEIWTLSDCTAQETFEISSPISGEPVYKIDSTNSLQYELEADEMIDSYINPELQSITFGFYFYPNSTNIKSLEIGYVEDSVEELSEFIVSRYSKWQYISKTLPLQDLETLSVTSDDLTTAEATPTIIESTGHGLIDGDRVKISSSFIMPDGINQYSVYYVVNSDTNTFEIEKSLGAGGIVFRYEEFGTLYFTKIKKITPIIKASLNYSTPSTAYISGLSSGQWSSEFMENSFGTQIEQVSGINIGEEYYGAESQAYGLSDNPGYYLVRENKLLAKNTNMPMVYGSSSLTSLSAERFGGPSLIIPGNGFLNESGKYKTHTFEMWIRISADTLEPKRIFGPISSADGLYVDGSFITLKVGEAIESHYIGEWYRPMLLNVLMFRNGASLVINGEKVFDLSFNTADLILPSEKSLSGKSQDWLGLYSYSDIQQFEIDCIALYSYRVPTAVSKRRWVYGQAVDFPENISSSYSGGSLPVDYTFSEYSNNYTYPDMVKWRQGTAENISLDNSVLQPPKYRLPRLIFNNKTSDSWYRALKNNQYSGINLKPDSSWVDTDGYLLFNNADVLQQKTAGFYGIFEPKIGLSATETLFRLQNQVSGNYLSVDLETVNKNISEINGTTISSPSHGLKQNDIIRFIGTLPSEILDQKEYYVTYIDNNSFSIRDSLADLAISSSSITADSVQFVAYFIKYSLLFNSTQETTIYQTPAITTGHSIVAGINFKQFSEHFGGNVATLVGNKRGLGLYVGGNSNFNKTFSGNIYRVGFCTKRNLDSLDYLFASNGVPFLRYQFDGGDVDEEVTSAIDAGYVYQDYVDDILSHTASYTLVAQSFFGERYLDIATSSYWQDYVPLSYLAKNIIGIDGKTSYSLDFVQYNSDTTVPTRFDNEGNYETDSAPVKIFITFQPVTLGPTKNDNLFATTKKLPKSKIVNPESDWRTTRYEVVNGTIIYMPPDTSLEELAMVIHVDMSSKGIIKNPIKIRSMQIASKSLNKLSPNPIKSKLGISFYPYTRYGIYYDYRAQNPHTVYKDSTPHLYLTKHSGIELTGNFSEPNRGISIPVNREKAGTYELSTLQLSMRFTRDDIITDAKEIINLESNVPSERIKIWIEPSYPSDKRFRIFATDNFDQETESVEFYINGKNAQNTIISKYDWNMLSVALRQPIDLGGVSGRINIVGPIMFNNLSYFALNASQLAKYTILNESEYVGVSAAEIYGIFTGTNKVIVSDGYSIFPESYRYSVINNLSLQSATIRPA
jgi:hypothetical protein